MAQPATETRSLPRPAASERAVEVAYLLVHTGPAPIESPDLAQRFAGVGLCGPGWTVLAAHGSRWSWSIRLDAHGAAYGAPARVAQAVAVRVLGDHAIDVLGWDPADPEAMAYVAAVAPSHIPRSGRSPSRWWR